MTKQEEHAHNLRYGIQNFSNHKVNSHQGGLNIAGHYQNQDFLNAKVRSFPGDSRNIHSDIRRTKQRLKENTPLILDNPYN